MSVNPGLVLQNDSMISMDLTNVCYRVHSITMLGQPYDEASFLYFPKARHFAIQAKEALTLHTVKVKQFINTDPLLI